MYDFKPKFSQKLSSNHSKHYTHNSLPKLTITAQNSVQKKTENIHQRKTTGKSHNFLQLFSLHKSYLSSSKVKTNRNKVKTPINLVDTGQSAKNNDGKNIKLRNNGKYMKGSKGDIQFCKQKLKQFKQEVTIVRDRLMLTQSLQLRVKTEVSQGYDGPNSILNKEEHTNLINIKSSKLEIKVGNFLRRRSKMEQKLSKVCPQSLVLKYKKSVLEDDFSPWDYTSPDLLNTQI